MNPGVRFVVAHDTGNPGSRAAANVAYYERSRNEASVSAHLFVDDSEIIECIPALTAALPEKAWHVRESPTADDRIYGFDANDAAIGVEYCYGPRINADEAYRRYVWVMAYACSLHGLDPSRAIVGHFFLDPTRRDDPVKGLGYSRRTYEQLLRDIVSEYVECSDEILPPGTPWPAAGRVVTRVRLNVREAPNLRAAIWQTLPTGTAVDYVAVVEGEAVNGNSVWLQDARNHVFWSGGVALDPNEIA